MKTLNVNLITPTQEEIENALEMFSSMAETVKGWSDEDSQNILDVLVDLDHKAIKTDMGWDALIPDLEVYDTFTTGLSAKYIVEEDVVTVTTGVKPEYFDLMVGVLPPIYLEVGCAIIDKENHSITTRFCNKDSAPFNDIKNGIEINLIKAA